MTAAHRTSSLRGFQWPKADELFRSDDRWLGSDDAYSIELSPGRVLWLFGDTFVEAGRSTMERVNATFIRNSVGIQNGSDPSSAQMEFFWQPGPDSFFAAPAGTWYWPLHGALIDGSLLLFMMLVRAPGGGSGDIDAWRRLGPLGFFDVFGWAAVRVENPHDRPDVWKIETLAVRPAPIVIGSSVLARENTILAYGWDRDKHIVLARWPKGASIRDEPEWWSMGAWRARATPEIVIDQGATEFSVHFDRSSGRWCQTQLFPRTQSIGLRWADRPEGPWSDPEDVFVPEEAQREGVLVYAGKAHPHLTGGDLVVTYASNADVDVCLGDRSIYYPRVVRLSQEPHDPNS